MRLAAQRPREFPQTNAGLNAAALPLLDVLAAAAPSLVAISVAIAEAGLEGARGISPRGLVDTLVQGGVLTRPEPGQLRMGPRGWMWIRSDPRFGAASCEAASLVFDGVLALVAAIVEIDDAEVDVELPMQRFTDASGVEAEHVDDAWSYLFAAAPHLVFRTREGFVRVRSAALDRGRLEEAVSRRGEPPWQVDDEELGDLDVDGGRSGMRRDGFRPFHEFRVTDVLHEYGKKVVASVDALSVSTISSRNEDELIEELVERHAVEVPTIDFDSKLLDETTVSIPAEHFPISCAVVRGRVYEKDAYLLRLPYRGDPIFLRCYESQTQMTGHHKFTIEDGRLTCEVFALDLTPEFVRHECESQIRFLAEYLEPIAYSVQAYNKGLPSRIRQLIEERKRKLQAKAQMLEQIGIPISRSVAPPATMAVAAPVTRHAIKVTMTESVAGRVPDPTIDEKTYTEILQALRRHAIAMERAPGTYASMGEEDIRNLLLSMLGVVFDTTSATGESFNKAGKTDILLRHGHHNLFVAECKIWKGQAAYLDAITQLLGYLTWRDSKAAVLMFVRGSDIAKVESVVRDVTPTHSDFVAEVGTYREGIARYTFKLPSTDGTEVRVAVLLFHLPK